MSDHTEPRTILDVVREARGVKPEAPLEIIRSGHGAIYDTVRAIRTASDGRSR